MNKDMNRDEAMAYMASTGKVVESITKAYDKIFKWENGCLLCSERGKSEWYTILQLPEWSYKIYTPKPAHKALCWAWFDKWERRRNAVFYNAKSDSAYTDFKNEQLKYGIKYENYEEIPRDQWPKWAEDAVKELED